MCIRDRIKEGVSILPMTVGKRKIMVTGVETTPGVPKSDFHLVDAEGNEVAWISHKDGNKASDFQQYGGLSHSVFAQNAEVKKFMEDLVKMFPNGLNRGDSVYRKAKDQTVVRQSVWGVNYTKRARGRDNVDEFHQGPMRVVKKGGSYQIVSNHQDTNGSIPRGQGYDAIYYLSLIHI